MIPRFCSTVILRCVTARPLAKALETIGARRPPPRGTRYFFSLQSALSSLALPVLLNARPRDGRVGGSGAGIQQGKDAGRRESSQIRGHSPTLAESAQDAPRGFHMLLSFLICFALPVHLLRQVYKIGFWGHFFVLEGVFFDLRFGFEKHTRKGPQHGI